MQAWSISLTMHGKEFYILAIVVVADVGLWELSGKGKFPEMCSWQHISFGKRISKDVTVWSFSMVAGVSRWRLPSARAPGSTMTEA